MARQVSSATSTTEINNKLKNIFSLKFTTLHFTQETILSIHNNTNLSNSTFPGTVFYL